MPTKDARERLEGLILHKPASRQTSRSAMAALRSSILAAAEAHGADLIILASHIPDFSNYFIGATADRVVRHAKCSVLVDRRRLDEVDGKDSMEELYERHPGPTRRF